MGQDNDILDLGSWCILRMASADTLKVTESLAGAGFDVWTPIEPYTGRSGRERRRCDKRRAIMPSYAFARVEHIDELLRVAMMPVRRHPAFSVFHYRGGVPVIADCQLGPLRAEQARVEGVFERAMRKTLKGPWIAPGTEVALAGAWEGLSGIVEDTQGQFTLVNVDVFGKTVTLKVASLLLADPEAAEQAKAA